MGGVFSALGSAVHGLFVPLLSVAHGLEETVGRVGLLRTHSSAFASVDDAVVAFGRSVLGDATLFKYVVALFLTVPLGVGTRWMPGGASGRHAYLAVVGLALLQWIFGARWIHAIVSCGAVYAFLGASGQAPASLGAWRAFACGLFAFAYLSVVHYGRYLQYYDARVAAAEGRSGDGIVAESIDYLAVQMVLTIKLYTFAYNVTDGAGAEGAINRAAAAELRDATAAAKSGAAPLDKKRLNYLRDRSERAARALPGGLPSPLAFAGFVLNFTTVLAGPAFEFKKYAASVDREDRAADAGRFAQGAWKLLQGIIFLVAQQLVSIYIPLSSLLPNAASGVGVPLQVAFAMASLSGVRWSYYFVWKVAEAAAVMAGFGHIDDEEDVGAARAARDKATAAAAAYSPRSAPDAKVGVEPYPSLFCWQHLPGVAWLLAVSDWDYVSNVDVVACETHPSLKVVFNKWNAHTQSWLQRYVFYRVPANATVAQFVTFAASAFWHGFFPGYYLGFFASFVFLRAAPAVTPFVKPLFKGSVASEFAFESVSLIVRNMALTSSLLAFNLFWADDAIAIWSAWYYFPFVIAAVALIGSTVYDAATGGGAKGETRSSRLDSSSSKEKEEGGEERSAEAIAAAVAAEAEADGPKMGGGKREPSRRKKTA